MTTAQTQTIPATLYNAIKEEVGSFVLVSMSPFSPFDGITRNRITVRKPKGKKFIHLIQYENGTVKRIN